MILAQFSAFYLRQTQAGRVATSKSKALQLCLWTAYIFHCEHFRPQWAKKNPHRLNDKADAYVANRLSSLRFVTVPGVFYICHRVIAYSISCPVAPISSSWTMNLWQFSYLHVLHYRKQSQFQKVARGTLLCYNYFRKKMMTCHVNERI